MPVPSGDPQVLDAAVRRTVYETFFREGQAPALHEVSDALDHPAADIARSFERLAEGHVLVLQPESGEILMANPFSAVPTPFLAATPGGVWWGNCIWDTLGILAMVGADGSVRSSCPDCGEALELMVQAGELSAARAVAHFSVPAARWWENIVFT